MSNEQQRIAELLTAIDEEISAQGEALAALKVHKRGLMQGLFPSGGVAGTVRAKALPEFVEVLRTGAVGGCGLKPC